MMLVMWMTVDDDSVDTHGVVTTPWVPVTASRHLLVG